MSDPATLTVCLLTFNHSHLLGSTIRSVLRQDMRTFEFIISDDCSTDRTWELLKHYQDYDSRIRAIQTPRNLQVAGNANFAVSHANGEYIALLHHDDIYRSDLLTRWINVAERNSQLGFVFNDYGTVDRPREGDHRNERRRFSEHMNGRVFLRKHLFKGWGCPVRGTALIRRTCWEAIGGMDSRFGLLADVDMWMRLSARWDVGYVNQPLILVRQERPKDYPDMYKNEQFTWARSRLLYTIHGINRDRHWEHARQAIPMRSHVFRWKVNLDILKWLLYAIIRKRHDIILSSFDGNYPYEFRVTRLFRGVLRKLVTNDWQTSDLRGNRI